MIDVATLDGGHNVVAAVFDDATHTWLLRTSSGDEYRARVVVDAERTLHCPKPKYPGASVFHGPSCHSSHWDTALDGAGKRVAIIGDRAAHIVSLLTQAELILFDCPPNWETRKAKRRRLPHHRTPKRSPRLVPSAVERITPAGVRTADGTDYDVDAIVYATGSAIANGLPDDVLVGSGGLTIQRAWQNDAEAYLGVAVHGFPNYFMLLGPDSPMGNTEQVHAGQMRYISECLQRMKRKGSTRVEVRRSAQRQFTQRAHVKSPASAFDIGCGDVRHDIYDGPATLTVGGDVHAVRVRLTGHLDPIDGKYHWQGMVFGATVELAAARPAMLATGAVTTEARITERTPWGSYSIAGLGAPPFELNHPT